MSKNKNWQRKEVEPTIIENTAVQVPEEYQPLEKENDVEEFFGLAKSARLEETIETDPMASIPKDGTRIYLAEELGDNFILGYWKRTRSVTKASRFKWLTGGKWVDAFGQNLKFEPRYWKDA